MTSTAAPPAAPAAATDPPDGETGGWHWLDTAGIIAGIILAVIVADIWSDGRLLSNRLRKRPEEQADAEQPAGD